MSSDRVSFIENELANARYNGYAKIAELCEAALAEIDELRRDSERWRHAKADFLVASEVDAIEARIDAGIFARKETT